jgi:hypothetical protein
LLLGCPRGRRLLLGPVVIVVVTGGVNKNTAHGGSDTATPPNPDIHIPKNTQHNSLRRVLLLAGLDVGADVVCRRRAGPALRARGLVDVHRLGWFVLCCFVFGFVCAPCVDWLVGALDE